MREDRATKAEVVFVDTETDGLDYTKVHCIAVKELGVETLLFTDKESFINWARRRTGSITMWVGHNICGFDWWVIRDILGLEIPQYMVYDTSVMSKLIDYRKFFTHSLKELGEHLGTHKGDYDGGWDEYSPAMGSYCVQDVNTLEAIWLNQKNELWDTPAAQVEHEIAFISAQMQKDGFKFDIDTAKSLLSDVEKEMTELEDVMKAEWPDQIVEDRRIQWREKPDGAPYLTCVKAMAAAPKWEREGDELILYRYKQFNPGSSKDRVEKLWDSGWNPFDKTEGHKKWQRERR